MIEVRVKYPAEADVVLRTAADWRADVSPVRIECGGTERVFELAPSEGVPLVYFKPLRRSAGRVDWAAGSNYLAVPGCQTVYPHFDGSQTGRITEKLVLGTGRTVRVYLPPGYDENSLKRYPVLYVLDGANVFFPDEAFSGEEWEIDETLDCLNAMNLVDKVIVVALYSEPEKREAEYTAPGYTGFAVELIEQILPDVARRWRTLAGPPNTAIMGSSLGGVASMYLGLEHGEHFGMAACISSTFGYRDDLLERVWRAPRQEVQFYLDAGWPGDHHRETLEIYDALVSCGLEPGRDVLFLGFPGALHHERAWAQRVHLPIQFFFGRAFRHSRHRSQHGTHTETVTPEHAP